VTEAGERRIVSVLITDIVDSTAIGERLGPDENVFPFGGSVVKQVCTRRGRELGRRQIGSAEPRFGS
jgi:class 3 adenylate cyclase